MRFGAALICLMGCGHEALARSRGAAVDAELRPSISLDEEPGSPQAGCGQQAILYALGGMKVWVTRRGTLEQDNPLRPLSRDKLIVLQVAVNGRLATAFGPDFDHLRQGGSPQRLEEASARPIRWAAEASDLPDSIRIVAEDGTVLLGPLAFKSCGAAPRVAAQAPPKAPKPAKAGAASRTATVPASRPNLTLPQGAIQ